MKSVWVIGWLVFCSVTSSFATRADTRVEVPDWRSFSWSQSGVYEEADGIFVFLQRDWSVATLNEHRRWARAQVGILVASEALGRQGATDFEQAVLRLDSTVSLNAKGRVLNNDKYQDRFVHVFWIDSFENVTAADIDIAGQMAKASDRIANDAQLLARLLSNRGEPLLASLLSFGKQSSVMSNIPRPIIPTVTVLDAQSRLTSVRKELAALVEDEVVRSAMLCLEEPSRFYSVLQERNITLISIPSAPANVALKALRSCQGFVAFEGDFDEITPVAWNTVKSLFDRGTNIELATFLLESLIALRPNQSEYWEYLSAAYEYAGADGDARLAIRPAILLAQDSDRKIALIHTLLRLEDSPTARQLSNY